MEINPNRTNPWADKGSLFFIKFILDETENVESPLNLAKLCSDYKTASGTPLTEKHLLSRIVCHRSKVQELNYLNNETKAKVLFGLSAPIDDYFYEILMKDADKVLKDNKRRIIEYENKEKGIRFGGTHYRLDPVCRTDTEEQLMVFMADKSQNATSPMETNTLLKQFIKWSGTKKSNEKVKQAFASFKSRIYGSNYDHDTKVNMMRCCSVRIPEDQRESETSSLFECIPKNRWSEAEELKFFDFIFKAAMGTTEQLNLNDLCKQYKEKSGTMRNQSSLRWKLDSYRNNYQDHPQLTNDMKTQIHYALSVDRINYSADKRSRKPGELEALFEQGSNKENGTRRRPNSSNVESSSSKMARLEVDPTFHQQKEIECEGTFPGPRHHISNFQEPHHLQQFEMSENNQNRSQQENVAPTEMTIPDVQSAGPKIPQNSRKDLQYAGGLPPIPFRYPTQGPPRHILNPGNFANNDQKPTAKELSDIQRVKNQQVKTEPVELILDDKEEPMISAAVAVSYLFGLAISYKSEVLKDQVADTKKAVRNLGDKKVPIEKIIAAFREGIDSASNNATVENMRKSASLKEFLSRIHFFLYQFNPFSTDLQQEIENQMRKLEVQDKKVPLRKISYAIERIFEGVKNL